MTTYAHASSCGIHRIRWSAKSEAEELAGDCDCAVGALEAMTKERDDLDEALDYVGESFCLTCQDPTHVAADHDRWHSDPVLAANMERWSTAAKTMTQVRALVDENAHLRGHIECLKASLSVWPVCAECERLAPLYDAVTYFTCSRCGTVSSSYPHWHAGEWCDGVVQAQEPYGVVTKVDVENRVITIESMLRTDPPKEPK